EPARDLVRLAAEQRAELLVVADLPTGSIDELCASAVCDVAVAARPELEFAPTGPAVVPFGGGREEWAAVELGAWLARAHGLPLRLLGREGTHGERDASRTLASASIALQRFAGTSAEPVVVPPGPEGILAQRASVIVASLPR